MEITNAYASTKEAKYYEERIIEEAQKQEQSEQELFEVKNGLPTVFSLASQKTIQHLSSLKSEVSHLSITVHFQAEFDLILQNSEIETLHLQFDETSEVINLQGLTNLVHLKELQFSGTETMAKAEKGLDGLEKEKFIDTLSTLPSLDHLEVFRLQDIYIGDDFDQFFEVLSQSPNCKALHLAVSDYYPRRALNLFTLPENGDFLKKIELLENLEEFHFHWPARQFRFEWSEKIANDGKSMGFAAADFEPLRQLPHLRVVNLDNSPFVWTRPEKKYSSIYGGYSNIEISWWMDGTQQRAGYNLLFSLSQLEDLSVDGCFFWGATVPLFNDHLRHLKTSMADFNKMSELLPNLESLVADKLLTYNGKRAMYFDELAKLEHLNSLSLRETHLPENAIEELIRKPSDSLRYLDLSFTTGVKPILFEKFAPHLTTLKLSGVQFTKSDREAFGWISGDSLRLLDLQLAKGVRGLPFHTFAPNLISLQLGSSDITSADMTSIGKISTLKILDVSNTSISAASIKKLTVLTELQELNLSGTKMEGASFDLLENLSQLQSVTLSNTYLTRADFAKLATLKQLKFLDLRGQQNPNITENEKMALVEALPGCQILL